MVSTGQNQLEEGTKAMDKVRELMMGFTSLWVLRSVVLGPSAMDTWRNHVKDSCSMVTGLSHALLSRLKKILYLRGYFANTTTASWGMIGRRVSLNLFCVGWAKHHQAL